MDRLGQVIQEELKNVRSDAYKARKDFLTFCEPYKYTKEEDGITMEYIDFDQIEKDGNMREYESLSLDSSVAAMRQKLAEDFIMSNSSIEGKNMVSNAAGTTINDIISRNEEKYDKRAEAIAKINAETIKNGGYVPKKETIVGGYVFSVKDGLTLREVATRYVEMLKDAVLRTYRNNDTVNFDQDEFEKAVRSACSSVVEQDNIEYIVANEVTKDANSNDYEAAKEEYGKKSVFANVLGKINSLSQSKDSENITIEEESRTK